MDQDVSQRRCVRVFLDAFVATLLVLAAAFFFMVMIFFPSMVELKKPKDRGPRRIRKQSLHKSIAHSPRLVSVPRSDSSVVRHRVEDLRKVLADVGIRSRRMDERTVRILEGVEFAPALEMLDDIVTEGAFKAGARCVFHGSIKAKGDVVIGEGVVIDGSLISLGDICIEDEVVIGGLVHSEGRAKLGEKVFVGLDLVAGGDVEIYDRSEVSGNILTRGPIRFLEHPKVELPKAIDDIG